MTEEIIEGWVKVFETFDFVESELVEAKLNDENIECQVLNKADIGYTMDIGNNAMGRNAVGIPLKIFVNPEDFEKALKIIGEDNSALLDDPNLDFSGDESEVK